MQNANALKERRPNFMKATMPKVNIKNKLFYPAQDLNNNFQPVISPKRKSPKSIIGAGPLKPKPITFAAQIPLKEPKTISILANKHHSPNKS